MPAQKPHDKWLNEHVDALLEISQSHSTPLGPSFHARSWTWLKLAALDYYIPIYLKILRPRYQRLVFIDLFAGSGESLYTDGPLSLCAPGSSVVAASYRQRSAESGLQFDEIFCVELDPRRAAALSTSVESFGYRNGVDLRISVEDTNSQTGAIQQFLSRPRTHALLFADPEGLDLHLSTLVSILKSHPATDVFVTHLNVGAARGQHPSSPARDRVYGTGAWRRCHTREDYTALYTGILQRLKDVVISIPIRGDFDAPGYQYDLFFAVRKTSTGSDWTKSIDRLKYQIQSLSGEDVRRILRTRATTVVGGKKTRQALLDGS